MKQIPNELAIEIDIPLDWKDTLAVDDFVPFFFFVALVPLVAVDLDPFESIE